MKKLIAVILVVFAVFWLFQDPRGMAIEAKEVFWWVIDAGEATFQQLIEFINGL